jgi:arylsulfatase A-like enzyme
MHFKSRRPARLLASLSALALAGVVPQAPARAQAPAPSQASQTIPANPGGRTNAADGRPNIILILSDDNSAPHDGCHPSEDLRANAVTPNFEAFARQGMCFDRAYDTSPQCAPSRGSIFAGRNPVDIGITRFAEPAGLDVRYFSDILRASGYWVGLEGRLHHLGGREGDPPHVKQALLESGMSRLSDRFDYVHVFGTKELSPEQLVGRLDKTFDTIPKDKPFFLYFGFNQTHRPFVTDHSDIKSARLHLPPDWPDMPEVREDYANLLSDLRSMDRQFGALMATLKARGLDRNTLIVFMGDNGEAMYRGKGTLYERGNRVPLIVRWPGVVQPGSRSSALVSGIDLAETFLEAARQQPDPRMTGTSLVPILRGSGGAGHEYVFTERGEHPGSLTVSEGVDFARAITGRRYKLIYNAQPGQPYSPVDQGGRFLAPEAPGSQILPAIARTDLDRALGAWKAVVSAHQQGTLSALHERLYFKRPRPIFELYDIELDPYELENLAGRPQYSAIETRLREELDKWMALSHDYLPFATDAFRETPDPERP